MILMIKKTMLQNKVGVSVRAESRTLRSLNIERFSTTLEVTKY